MKNKLLLVLFIICILHIAFKIYSYRAEYLILYDPKNFENAYNKSQWVVVNSQNPIGDDIVYVHAGAQYLQGRDPTTLNAELPPFGKYLIGISAAIFKNHNIFAVLSGIFALIALYLLNLALFKNKLYAFIPVFLFSLEPLFYSQLRTALLDTLYLGLICLTFYFLIKKRLFKSAIFLGLAAATKATASTFPLIIGTSVLYILITKQFALLKKYIFSVIFAVGVFLTSYLQFFLSGKSFIEFLSIQKWILNFYAGGAKGSMTAPWEMIFTGSFANWFGGQSVVTEWHIGWPILFIVAVFSGIYILFKYRQKPIILIVVWIFLYFIFLSFIPLWSRYFLLMLPFMYTLCTWFIVQRVTKHEIK